MRVSRFCVSVAALSVAGTLGAAPAVAASPENSKVAVPPPVIVVSDDKAANKKSPPDFAAMLAMFDKLFPPQPDPDPARLALARTSVQSMWPEGAYGQMMTGFMGGIFDRVMQMKQSDLAALGSKPKKTPAAAGADLSLHDQAAAKDPYFDKRMAAIRDAVGEELGKLSAIIDPRVRDGLARSMARRFDAQQLKDINTFFATPSGRALAGQSMQLWVDPDMLRSLFGAMPEMIKLMPDMMQRMKAVDEKFPKPPKAPATPAKADKH